ncbi:hypothetical protein EC973_003163 [Apophysomyces ossiformis]|uniref:non-specific serine/threonine protein kinase n=1 Tax=Apophysomyces ossiformis TaxID=679940 RepID=A0A8H7BI76_9FUNG|nr:hypothetical protein EC973_003163 [Apophysomyces ossiformis]
MPITERLRKFSLQPKTQLEDVVTTNYICKDYDASTGNKIINNYMIITEIGRGVHGKVKLAEDLDTNELVAIKIVDKRTRRKQLGMLRGNAQVDAKLHKENEQKIRREIAILKKCVHPHVVRLREVIDDPASRKIYMALEYMEGGEIQWRDEYDQPVLSISEARSIFRDVVSGLDYLHHQGIIHRDIKPANLLYTKEGIVKISDFGVSYFNELLAGDRVIHQTCMEIDRELAETAGTPAFFAPELCSGEDDQQRVTKAIDIWALGVTLYCFVFGRCPFNAVTEFELFDIIPTQPLAFPDPEEIDFEVCNDLKDLLYRLLAKVPQERITLEEVKIHPWVIADLQDPQIWWETADPRQRKIVEINDEDMVQAVTIMDRLRNTIHKLSSSLSFFARGFSRRRSKSASQAAQIPNHSAISSISFQRSMTEDQHLDFHKRDSPSSASSASGLMVHFGRSGNLTLPCQP